VQGIAFCFVKRLREDASGNGNGIRTADANNGDGSTWRGGKGANGILFHLITFNIEDLILKI
jgi:hypothetical protein